MCRPYLSMFVTFLLLLFMLLGEFMILFILLLLLLPPLEKGDLGELKSFNARCTTKVHLELNEFNPSQPPFI